MSYNVLVVDDSKTARMMLAKTLRISGLQINEVFMAENGARALEVLREEWIDLVLTDLHMPVMSGMEMVEKMAADGLLSSLPVVVITSDASQQRMKELQGTEYATISANLRPEHVKKTIENILKGNNMSDLLNSDDENRVFSVNAMEETLSSVLQEQAFMFGEYEDALDIAATPTPPYQYARIEFDGPCLGRLGLALSSQPTQRIDWQHARPRDRRDRTRRRPRCAHGVAQRRMW